MSSVKSGKDFEQASTKRCVNFASTFCFTMPDSVMLPSILEGMDMKRGSQRLPPSIRVIQPASKKSSIASHSSIPEICDVVYCIEARLFLRGHLVSQAVREIILMPVAAIPPPTEPGDFQNEYRLFTSSGLGTRWRRGNSSTVSMYSSEPRPLLFGIPDAKEEILPSQLVLGFSARQMFRSTDFETLERPPDITECNLTITLEATTYFLRDEAESILSIMEACNTPFAVIKTTKFKCQRLKFQFLTWNRARDSTCRSCHPEPSLFARQYTLTSISP